MHKNLIIAAGFAAFIAAPAHADCTAEDVQALQEPLLAAVSTLLSTDPAKAQALVADLQAKMAIAIETEDEEAPCIIFQDALDQINE